MHVKVTFFLLLYKVIQANPFAPIKSIHFMQKHISESLGELARSVSRGTDPSRERGENKTEKQNTHN